MDNAAESNTLDNSETQSQENQPGRGADNQPEEQASAEAGAEPSHEGHDHSEHAGDGHSHAERAGVPPMDPACKREVEVEIPADVVTKQQDKLIKEYAKQARIPGFRKGKVPASMVKNRFSNEITSDVVESLVPQYFRDAVSKAGHRPISQPHIYGLEYTPGEPMRFKAAFEVLPDFELGDYSAIKVEKPNVDVTDEELDAEIKQLQERQASYDPIEGDRGAENGDFVQVSFEARPKNAGGAEPKPEAASSEGTSAEGAESTEKPQPVHMDEVLVEIGGANTIPEFTEHLSGAKAGEERKFDVVYPDDFYDKRLAGKTFSYNVKVNALKKKNIPELNDEFAKELSPEFASIDDLKQMIRDNMEAERKHKAELEAKEKIVDELLAKHDFPVPRSLVEHQIELRLERGLRALAAQGMKPEDMKRMDFARLRAGQLEPAVKEVKANILLAKVALKENIQVNDEDLDQEISAMAQQMQQPVEEVKKRLTQDNAVERLRDRMRTEKALNLLYNKSA